MCKIVEDLIPMRLSQAYRLPESMTNGTQKVITSCDASQVLCIVLQYLDVFVCKMDFLIFTPSCFLIFSSFHPLKEVGP